MTPHISWLVAIAALIIIIAAAVWFVNEISSEDALIRLFNERVTVNVQ
jgi:hypothetical protein